MVSKRMALQYEHAGRVEDVEEGCTFGIDDCVIRDAVEAERVLHCTIVQTHAGDGGRLGVRREWQLAKGFDVKSPRREGRGCHLWMSSPNEADRRKGRSVRSRSRGMDGTAIISGEAS
jgi:hypothetical protein